MGFLNRPSPRRRLDLWPLLVKALLLAVVGTGMTTERRTLRAQKLPQIDVPNAQCGKDLRARQLSFYGREGSWIPEADLGLPVTGGVGEIPEDPTTLVELSRFHPDCPPDPALNQRAAAFVQRAYRVAMERGWDDFDRARRDGFEPYKAHAHNETHFVNIENSLDDRVADPEAPEYLMYYPTPDGPLLVGMMLMVRRLGEHGPQFGGANTVWHYHAYEKPACIDRMQISSARDTSQGPICERGELAGFKSPEMMHVWFVDHPLGPYATSMQLPKDVLQRGIRSDLKALIP